MGSVLAFLSWPALGRMIDHTGFLVLPALSEPLTVWAWTFGPGIAFVVLFLALILGTRQLKKVEPVEAVMEMPEQAPSRSIVRLII